MDQHVHFMQEAIRIATHGIRTNQGGPFGAVIVKNGLIVGKGNNQVSSTNDPTAHAEMVAIREACKNLGHFQLDDCIIYTTCEPCPMCLGAIYWARPKRIYYACDRGDAAAINFDDDYIYREMELPLAQRRIPAVSLLRNEGLMLFEEWRHKNDKTLY
jgi:tRNA(Arg) A34 adenosine deaminase TadA